MSMPDWAPWAAGIGAMGAYVLGALYVRHRRSRAEDARRLAAAERDRFVRAATERQAARRKAIQPAPLPSEHPSMADDPYWLRDSGNGAPPGVSVVEVHADDPPPHFMPTDRSET